MKFSELIAAYGDDKVQFQKLDECASDFNMGKRGTKITFVTDEPFTLNGTQKLGLVLWLDRNRVKEILGQCKRCKGTGTVADYVGDDMRCIETSCPDCQVEPAK